MKERAFHPRYDLDAGANIRRLHAFIRSIAPAHRFTPKLLARANQRAILKRIK